MVLPRPRRAGAGVAAARPQRPLPAGDGDLHRALLFDLHRKAQPLRAAGLPGLRADDGEVCGGVGRLGEGAADVAAVAHRRPVLPRRALLPARSGGADCGAEGRTRAGLGLLGARRAAARDGCRHPGGARQEAAAARSVGARDRVGGRLRLHLDDRLPDVRRLQIGPRIRPRYPGVHHRVARRRSRCPRLRHRQPHRPVRLLLRRGVFHQDQQRGGSGATPRSECARAGGGECRSSRRTSR